MKYDNVDTLNGSTFSLTTRQASSLLGVHESSVKRWCDRGSLPCRLTAGGHRRLDLDSLLDFARQSRSSASILQLTGFERDAWVGSEELRSGRTSGPLLDHCYTWLQDDREDRLASLLQFLLEQGHNVERLCDDVVAPAAHRIGDQWQAGRAGVGDEHRMSHLLLDALLSLRGRRRAHADAPAAIVATAEGNHHELGAQMVRLALENGGWRVIYLGADLPTEDLAAQQRRANARLVCLSFIPPQIPSDVDRILRSLALHYENSVAPAVAVGGTAAADATTSERAFPFPAVRTFTRIDRFARWAAEYQSTLTRLN